MHNSNGKKKQVAYLAVLESPLHHKLGGTLVQTHTHTFTEWKLAQRPYKTICNSGESFDGLWFIRNATSDMGLRASIHHAVATLEREQMSESKKHCARDIRNIYSRFQKTLNTNGHRWKRKKTFHKRTFMGTLRIMFNKFTPSHFLNCQVMYVQHFCSSSGKARQLQQQSLIRGTLKIYTWNALSSVCINIVYVCIYICTWE